MVYLHASPDAGQCLLCSVYGVICLRYSGWLMSFCLPVLLNVGMQLIITISCGLLV